MDKQTRIQCTNCNGDGLLWKANFSGEGRISDECPMCKGEGEINVPACIPVQQSPTDAVAFIRWLARMNDEHKIVLVDGEWYWDSDKDGDQPISEETLYRLFNPSGAAPQAEGWAVGDRAMNNMLRDQVTLKAAPQAAGPVVIEDMVKALEQVNGFSTGKLGSKYLGCIIADCNAALDNYYKSESGAAAQRPGCPVWVKASLRLPPDSGDYCLLIDLGDVDIYGVGPYDPEIEGFRNEAMGRLGHPVDKVQWLDESGQLVFTREQVGEAVYNAVGHFASISGVKISGEYLNEWFKSEYPETK